MGSLSSVITVFFLFTMNSKLTARPSTVRLLFVVATPIGRILIARFAGFSRSFAVFPPTCLRLRAGLLHPIHHRRHLLTVSEMKYFLRLHEVSNTLTVTTSMPVRWFVYSCLIHSFSKD